MGVPVMARRVWLWLLSGLLACRVVSPSLALRWARLRPICGAQEDFSLGDEFGSFASSTVGSAPPAPSFQPSFTAPTTTFGGPGPSGGPSGLSKFLGGMEKSFTSSPLDSLTKALGLGATAFGISNQLSTAGQLDKQSRTIERGQKAAETAAAPAVAFGTETLNRAAAGQLAPALQAQIDEWTQRAKADAHARLASMGLGNSTDVNQLEALIDQQAMAMKGQMLTQQEETGLAGLQTGVSAGTSVMGVSQAQQQQLASLIQQANQALGSMAGRSPA